MKFHASRTRFSLLAILAALLLTGGLLRPAGLALASPVDQPSAQAGSISMSTVRVDIWPEYDQPSVLVIYNITLASTTSMPATLSVRIPAEAGKPHAVAYKDNAVMYSLNYNTAAAGEWIEVRFTSPLPDIVIEYYDPTLKKTGNQRSFTFRWAGDYSAEALSLRIQQPINATNVTFRPDAGPGTVQDNLTYYNFNAGKVPAGTTFDLAMNYSKPDDTLTNPSQFQNAEPGQPVDASTPGRVRLDQVLPWALGGLGLLLIAGGLIWYLRTGRAPSAAAARGARRHARHTPSAVVDAETDPNNSVFCHHCGKKAGPGDVFCRACGTKLR